ncbi:MAG: CCA-adding enzyme [Firmicutes bacterium ADurb.Bin182]|nr:MAG: CCA-adding enzyme [Firmicutes bacterium ADurb.Bin182]
MDRLTEHTVPAAIKELARLFQNAGARLYAVGGMVRNPLLGLPVSDVDVCSSLRPDSVRSLCENNGLRMVPKGIDYGTVEIMVGDGKGTIGVEHTTFRGDTYAPGGSHRPSAVSFSDSPEEDAFRRDFTVNALYLDILRGELIDPTGGMEDIRKRQIRATSKDPREIMRSDGLRLLRMVRFAAELSFSVEEKTLAAAKECITGLKDIAFERIRDELFKILLSDARYPKADTEGNPVLDALVTLNEIKALDVILPELAKGRGIAQNPVYHAFDVLTHALHACSEAPPVLDLRLSALLHDIGKPYAIERNGLSAVTVPDGVRHSPMLYHEKIGASISREILSRLCCQNELIDTVSSLVLWHMYDINAKAKESTLRVRFAQWGEEFTKKLICLREADVRGSGLTTGPVASAERWKRILKGMKEQNAPFSVNELQCDGNDIMEWLGIGPSAAVGEIKKKLLRHCAKFPKDNTCERLKRIVKGMAEAGGR